MKIVSLAAFVLAVPLSLILAVWGYIQNFVDLIHSDAVTSLVLLRIVGVVIPFIGAVLGWTT